LNYGSDIKGQNGYKIGHELILLNGNIKGLVSGDNKGGKC